MEATSNRHKSIAKNNTWTQCKLKKSLYGLKQAGRSWYEKIDAALLKFDFTRLATDNCIYIKRSNDYLIIIALYVDDLFILSDSIPKLKQFKQQLASTFEMMDMGEARFILGIKIDHDRIKRTLSTSTKSSPITK